MLIVYSLILILAFSAFGILIVNNYKDIRMRNVEVRLFQTANIVADTYKANMEDIIYTRFMVKSYGQQAGSRILILDKNKNVLVDNYNALINKALDNREIRNSLKGNSSSGIYTINNEEVLHISVPITRNDGLEIQIIGAVLISTSMDSLNLDIQTLKDSMLKIAIAALTISLAVVIIFSNRITKPLRELTYGVEKLSTGDLGFHIDRKRDDEIGRLIQSFNDMSHKLNTIEQNRKTFINSISHELRTPLTSIKALIDSLLIGDNSIDTYREYLGDVYNETERMERLVGYLTTSIRLEDMILDIKACELNSILDEAVKLMAPYAKKMEVDIKFKSTEDIVIMCDRDRIKEVFINLIDNSIKYRDEQKDNNYVIVALKNCKDHIAVTVRDNGLGISRSELSNIFQGGFRILDKGIIKGENIKGYGIGLAIVKNVLDKHNWTISVDSLPKQGSVFTIIIPT